MPSAALSLIEFTRLLMKSSIRAKTTLVVPMALPEIVQADAPLLAANFPRRFAGVAYLV
jgi:hypothetical protein